MVAVATIEPSRYYTEATFRRMLAEVTFGNSTADFLKAIPADGGESMPELPFVTLEVISEMIEGVPASKSSYSSSQDDITETELITVSAEYRAQWYSDKNTDPNGAGAFDRARLFAAWAQSNEGSEYATERNFVMMLTGPVVNADLATGMHRYGIPENYIERAALDMRFGYSARLNYSADYFAEFTIQTRVETSRPPDYYETETLEVRQEE